MSVRSVRLDPAAGFTAPQSAASFPALRAWYKCNEGVGTKIINAADPSVGILDVDQDAGFDPWVTPGAVRTARVSPRSVWRSEALGATPCAWVGSRSALIVLDITRHETPVDSVDQAIFYFGAASATAATGNGIRVMLPGTNNRISVSAAGALANLSLISTGTGTFPIGERTHWALFWDRTSTSQGTWNFYRNGVFLTDLTLSADPGSIALSAGNANSRISIGTRPASSTTEGAFTLHEAQFWTMTSLPVAEKAAIAARAFVNRERLPEQLAGVT